MNQPTFFPRGIANHLPDLFRNANGHVSSGAFGATGCAKRSAPAHGKWPAAEVKTIVSQRIRATYADRFGTSPGRPHGRTEPEQPRPARVRTVVGSHWEAPEAEGRCKNHAAASLAPACVARKLAVGWQRTTRTDLSFEWTLRIFIPGRREARVFWPFATAASFCRCWMRQRCGESHVSQSPAGSLTVSTVISRVDACESNVQMSGDAENRRAYARRSPSGMQLRGELGVGAFLDSRCSLIENRTSSDN